jgi:uncharacterized membrane-anchored protein
MKSGLMGGLGGGVVGVLGGIIGTYFSIKNTKGPRERAFVVKSSIVCWVFVLAFILGMSLLPGAYKLWLVPFYVGGLLFGIRWWNKKQAQIRSEESNRED